MLVFFSGPAFLQGDSLCNMLGKISCENDKQKVVDLFIISPYSTVLSVSAHFTILMFTTSLSLIFSLSQFDLPLSEVVIKRGTHSESWPYPVEICHGKDTIHVSMFVDRDQNLLVDTVQLHQGGHVTRVSVCVGGERERERERESLLYE